MYPFQYFGQAILSRGEFFKLKSMLRHKKVAHSDPLMLASPIVKAAFLVFAQMIYAAFTPCHLQSLYRIDGLYLSEQEECVSTCERPIPTLITWPTSTQLLVLTVNLFALSIPTTDTELLSALLWKSLGEGGVALLRLREKIWFWQNVMTAISSDLIEIIGKQLCLAKKWPLLKG